MAANRKFVPEVTIYGARIMFRNMRGEAGEYNEAGKRSFAINLKDAPELAEKMKADGWNIKELPAREEGDTPTPYITVKVSFEKKRPMIYQIIGNRKTLLDENNVGTLDFARLDNVDVTITPSFWSKGGRSGITAYVNALYATVHQDDLALKYADYVDSAYTSTDALDVATAEFEY